MEKALAAAYNRGISRQTPTRCPRTIYDAEITGFLDQHYSSSLIPHGENFVIRCPTAAYTGVEVCINSFNSILRCVRNPRTESDKTHCLAVEKHGKLLFIVWCIYISSRNICFLRVKWNGYTFLDSIRRISIKM